MDQFELNPETLSKLDRFSGAPMYRAKYRCADCCNPIKKAFAGPHGTCYQCGPGDLDISPLDIIEAVGLYLTREYWDEGQGPVIDGLIAFGNEFLAAKDLNHTEKMIDILSLGIMNAQFTNFDLLVIPPSSSDGPNHMKPKAEGIESRFGIDFEDAIVDLRPDIEMKKIARAQERRQVAREKFECQTNTQDERVLILDDLMTSCATTIGVAEAVHDKGASQIGAVSIARAVDLRALEDCELIIEQ